MATISTTTSGNSNATGTWAGGAIPVDGDKVNILNGHTVTMTGTHVWGDDTSTGINVKSGGIIKASHSASSELTCKGEMVIEAGGELDYGKAGDVISASYTHKIRLNFSASMADGKWGFKTLINGSKFHMWGTVKTTNTDLTTRLAASGTSFDVTNATGWAVGDIVLLGTTSPGNTKAENEERVISSVSTNTIGISVGATNDHEIGCRISNFTKNVGFEAHTDANESYTWFDESAGGTAGDKTISHAQFRYMGDDGSSNEYGGFRIDGNGTNHVEWTTMTDVAIYKGQYAGVDLYSFSASLTTPKTLSNFAIYTTVNMGVYCRSISGGNFNNWHVFNTQNYCLYSAWGNGMVNANWNDCWFMGGYGFLCGEGWNITFTRCKFVSCYRAIQTYNHKALKFVDCDMGYILNSFDGSSQYIIYMYLYGCTDALFTNCNFNYTSSLLLHGTTGVAQKLNKFYIERKNGDWNSQEIHTSEGSFFKNSGGQTAAYSLRAEPVAAAAETLDYEWYIPAPSGVAVTVTGYMQKNSSYGSATRPAMTFSGMGITPVVATMTDITDTWYAFSVSATQSTGASGVLRLTWSTQSANSSATATLSDVTHSMPASDIDTGDMLWWHDGRPIQAIMRNNQGPVTNANIVQISGDATAADNCELMFDGTGYQGGTEKLWVDTREISGDSGAADNMEADYDGTGYAGGTIDKGANVTEWLGTAVTAATAGMPDINVEKIGNYGTPPGVLAEMFDGKIGTADSGTTTTMVDAAITWAQDDAAIGGIIKFTGGTNNDLTRLITDYDQGTDTVTFTPALPNAVTTETYVVCHGMGLANVEAWKGTAVEAATAGIPDVNAGKVSNSSTAAANLKAMYDGTGYAGGTEKLQVDAVEINSSDKPAKALQQWLDEASVGGTASSGSTTTLRDTGVLTQADDCWNGSLLQIRAGNNAGFSAVVTDFDAGTDTVTFAPAMPSSIDGTSTYVLIPGLGLANVEAWKGTAVPAPDTAGIPKVNMQEMNGQEGDVNVLQTWLNAGVASTADSGTTTTAVDSALSGFADGAFVGGIISFNSGTNDRRSAIITTFDQGTTTLTFLPALADAVTTEKFSIVAGMGHANVEAWKGTAVSDAGGAGYPDVNVARIGTSINPATVLSTWLNEGLSGVSDSGTTTTLVDSAVTDADDRWNGGLLVICNGTNNGYSALITDWDNGTNTFTFTPALPNAMTTEGYVVVPGIGHANVEAWRGNQPNLTSGGDLPANVNKVNAVDVGGSGTHGDEWGPE